MHLGDLHIGDMPRLEQVLKRVKRQYAKKNPVQKPMLPMTPELLAKIRVMHLVRCLSFLKAKWEFVLFASHIPGVANDLVDALSRDNVSHFLLHYPQALPTPAPLSQELLDLTIIQKPFLLVSVFSMATTAALSQ